jgi:hypothetical protein
MKHKKQKDHVHFTDTEKDLHQVTQDSKLPWNKFTFNGMDEKFRGSC